MQSVTAAQSTKRRSNKPVTAFACDAIDKFLGERLKTGIAELHNTKVICSEARGFRVLEIFLHETRLLTLVLDANNKIVHIGMSIGDRFTFKNGFPCETILERLNGILDTLGMHEVIPDRVRVFKDRDRNVFCLGRGYGMLDIGRDYAHNWSLLSDSREFAIESSDLKLWQGK